jgi:hypothetical protein
MDEQKVSLKPGDGQCLVIGCENVAKFRFRIGLGVVDSCLEHAEIGRAEAHKINDSLGTPDANILHSCVSQLAFKGR